MSWALLCSGQGGQSATMFDGIAGDAAAAALRDAATPYLPAAPRELLAGAADIFSNSIAQPLVCAAALARWESLRGALPAPHVVLGYSVGELAAHAIAGSFTAAECLRLAARRAALMDAAAFPGAGLLAVRGVAPARLAQLCAATGATPAIVNGPRHVVLGGDADALAALAAALAGSGAHVVRLPVAVAAHTPQLRAAAVAFAAELERAALATPQLTVLAGIDAAPVRERGRLVATLAAQIAQTVDWERCLAQAVERGATVLFELGPGSALARIARENHPQVAARALDEFASSAGAARWLRQALAAAPGGDAGST